MASPEHPLSLLLGGIRLLAQGLRLDSLGLSISLGLSPPYDASKCFHRCAKAIVQFWQL